ncbi:hypothetical protein CH306_26030 [Rhodococcus sp. 15-725-2-2b]|uniref:DUF2637 domain-containing protein n=1 Tax=unclassified Rhodococcus (in: high G+C Gram-positive bacteria) TaxID=192944 RepID=UPI000B9BA015|nr:MULTISPECIES: DUF2637 domain-containing protein [unclassified Rhodococcus (in: high G+C Gram-positive bacteria)]OZC63640.1 hypothetical protein CH277_22630 [Rhodococcus sp. 06-469-3-2]OZD40805.1 hypothetical protein CH264_24315 [Rhodococcus sp. 06-1477-1A]OZE67087.1 hypothetical protein CH306_26030 [Rhodococcus sp. 15-725-2-2b]
MRTDQSRTIGSPPVFAVHPQVLFAALMTGIALTVGIAASSFWLSFAALRELAIMAGTDPGRAWVLPVVLDGAIVATTVIALALSHHTDARTVRGRTFVLGMLAVAAGASILGNAYHATSTPNTVPPVVAAAIATVAPIFLLGMTEVLAVILRAPRRREEVLAESQPQQLHPYLDRLNAEASSPMTHSSGGLDPAIWKTVLVYLQHPEWSYSDVANELGVDTGTVGTRLAEWFDLQMITAKHVGTNQNAQHTTTRSSLEKPDVIPALA